MKIELKNKHPGDQKQMQDTIMLIQLHLTLYFSTKLIIF